MTDPTIDAIQRIMSEADQILREKLKAAGVNVAHVLLAVNEDGVGIIRSNVDAPALHDMAELLDEIAEETGKMEPDRPN